MTRYSKAFAAFLMAAGLAIPASLSRADSKIPTPNDSKTGEAPSNLATGSSNSSDSSKLSEQDQKFVKEAANGGLAEVELGKTAQEKGQSQAVKDFGKKMVEDHGKANEKLKTLASSKGITLSSELKGEEKKHVEKLSALSGAEFDKAYTEHMIKDHRKDIAAFRKESKEGQDADIKAFATDTLPTLREHLKTIRQVAMDSGDTDLAKLASERQTPKKEKQTEKTTEQK